MIKSDNNAFFADQDAILPIDELMQRDQVKAEWFYPGEFQSRTWKGKTYGLPNVTAGALHLFFANTKLLKQVGWDPAKPIETWQDLEALIEPAKKQGLFVLDPAKISTGMTAHIVFTYANGGRYWDDDLKKILWNEPPAVEAAEWMLEFVKRQAGKYENLAIASDRKNVIQPEDWAPEKYITMINGSWSFFLLKQKAPHIAYAAYTFPRNAHNSQSQGHTPTTGGWMFSIAKQGKDQEAAWEWIKFTTTSKHACSFVKAQSRPSPLQDCNEDPELAGGNPFWSVVTRDLATNIAVSTTSVHPQFIQLWLDMEDAILFERMKPKEALDSFAEKGQQLLDKWNAEQKKG
jgi:ABC-type glycerol-3-phosphate transport system substrate-binding protein